eukprot:scaffold25105_cov86-Isochrysis_galbana.AAC.1
MSRLNHLRGRSWNWDLFNLNIDHVGFGAAHLCPSLLVRDGDNVVRPGARRHRRVPKRSGGVLDPE